LVLSSIQKRTCTPPMAQMLGVVGPPPLNYLDVSPDRSDQCDDRSPVKEKHDERRNRIGKERIGARGSAAEDEARARQSAKPNRFSVLIFRFYSCTPKKGARRTATDNALALIGSGRA
jgi:hypothetical protein